LFFGKKDSKMVFALPGNPASTLNCFYVYVVPILHKLLGKKSDGLACIHTTIDSSISNKFGRALFLKALVHESQAHIIDEHNSATLLSFSKANALVFVPSYTTLMEKGTRAKTWLIPN
jgi:molybdopterin molybdotransferase